MGLKPVRRAAESCALAGLNFLAGLTGSPLRAKPVDTIATDDVLAVLKPIWTAKAETASRVRGPIEKVLDAAKAKGFREGENPARWRGHLDHLLPRPSKLARGHHAAMPYEDVAVFIAKLRTRKASSALALELCILTAARSGEILGMRWPKIYLDKTIWTVPADRRGTSNSARSMLRCMSPEMARSCRTEMSALQSLSGINRT